MTPQVELLTTAAARDELLVQELAQLINRAYAAGETGLWIEGTARITPAEVVDAIRGGAMLVATLEDRIAGCACVLPIDASTADLGLISAAPERRSRGVGRALVRRAEAMMRARGVDTMQLELLVPRGWVHPDKEHLRAWYTRLGYRLVRSAPFDEVAPRQASRVATPCEFLVFAKPLALQ